MPSPSARDCLLCRHSAFRGRCPETGDGAHVLPAEPGSPPATATVLRAEPVEAIRYAEDRSNWGDVCAFAGRRIYIDPGTWLVRTPLDPSCVINMSDVGVAKMFGSAAVETASPTLV